VIAAVVLGAALVITVAVIAWRRRRRSGDLIGRHERAMSTLRDFYEHPIPGTPGFGNGHDVIDVETNAIDRADDLALEMDDGGPAPSSGTAEPVSPFAPGFETADPVVARQRPPHHGYPGPVAPRGVPDLETRVAAARDTSERATRQSISAVGALATPIREPDHHHLGNGRYRRGLTVAGVAVVAIVAVAAIVGLVSGSNSPSHRGSPPVTALSQASPTTTVPSTTSTSIVTTPTTSLANLAVVVRNGIPTVVVHPPFALTLVASQPCWVDVRDATSGQDLFTGTLQSGQTQQVPVPGSANMRIGNSRGLSISVDGTVLDTQSLGSVSNLDLSST
jgi:hypothetical protein